MILVFCVCWTSKSGHEFVLWCVKKKDANHEAVVTKRLRPSEESRRCCQRPSCMLLNMQWFNIVDAIIYHHHNGHHHRLNRMLLIMQWFSIIDSTCSLFLQAWVLLVLLVICSTTKIQKTLPPQVNTAWPWLNCMFSNMQWFNIMHSTCSDSTACCWTCSGCSYPCSCPLWLLGLLTLLALVMVVGLIRKKKKNENILCLLKFMDSPEDLIIW